MSPGKSVPPVRSKTGDYNVYGLSGSGKSTLAHGLERRLFDKGHVVTVLDGKAMRLGISKFATRREGPR